MNRRRTSGLSLVELLAAIAIGGLLLGGAVTLFINNRATYEITNDVARMQESARFALETMVRDLRMAGYVGCFNAAGTNLVNNETGSSAGDLWDPAFPIEGFDPDAAGAARWLPSGHLGAASDAALAVNSFGAAGIPTDGITVRYLIGNRIDSDANGTPDFQLVNSVYPGSRSIQLDGVNLATAGIVPGAPAALSDCGSADVFLVANDPAASGSILASSLTRAYDPINEALFSTMVAARYFVHDNGQGVPSLYRGTFTPQAPPNQPLERADELVDGVDTLQVLYGIDSNGDGNIEAFLPADQVDVNWNAVVAVRIALLMRTVDEYGREEEIVRPRFQVADKLFCPTGDADAACEEFYPVDRRRRRVYQTTIRLRNFG